MLEKCIILNRFIAVSRTPDLERKICIFSHKTGVSKADVQSAFLDVKQHAGRYREFNSTDFLFFAVLPFLKENPSSHQILSDVFNGFMSPFGYQYASLYNANPFSVTTLSSVDFSSYAGIKITYAPFRAVMVFDDIKWVVIAKLKNYLPRHAETPERLQMLDRLREDITDWAIKTGFSEDQVAALKKGDFINLAWRAMPLVSSDRYDRVLTYGKFLSVLFFHDDSGDNLSAIGSGENAIKAIEKRNYILMQTFKGKLWFKKHDDPVIRAAVEVVHYVADLCCDKPDLNFDWFSESMAMYFQKSSQEFRDIVHEHIITDGYYLEHLRPYTSNLYACFALSAILQEIPVAQSDLGESARIHPLVKNANIRIAIANDIVSYPKQITHRAISLVLVKLLQLARDFDIIRVDQVFLKKTDLGTIAETRPTLLQGAVETVVTTLNNYMAAYYQASRELSPELQQIDSAVIRPWIVGNGDWQAASSDRDLRARGLPVEIEACTDELERMGYRVIDLSN